MSRNLQVRARSCPHPHRARRLCSAGVWVPARGSLTTMPPSGFQARGPDTRIAGQNLHLQYRLSSKGD